MPRQGNKLGGRTFGRLTVVREARKQKGGNRRWLCSCQCGKQVIVYGQNLTGGKTQSCGCLQKERRIKHGQARRKFSGRFRKEYNVWNKLKRRCRSNVNYTGRIAVCQKWLDSFTAFLSDMGPIPSQKHTIERLNNDGDYRPGNCVWATRAEQARNRRTNRRFTFAGQTLTLMDWASKLGIKYNTLWGRLDLGWTVRRALTTKPGRYTSKRRK